MAPGAVVRDSILLHDVHVAAGAMLDLVIADKNVHIGANAVVGQGDKKSVNQRFPTHLDTGITLLGKSARIPAGAKIGRNCLILPRAPERDFPAEITSGQTFPTT